MKLQPGQSSASPVRLIVRLFLVIIWAVHSTQSKMQKVADNPSIIAYYKGELDPKESPVWTPVNENGAVIRCKKTVN